jgi:isocitrate dehydrogenase kinase/phosphatase
LLLKNFGVTSHGRVIFYDYDEICLVSDCVFRDLPRARTEEEELSAEPWFHCGPRDVFPEQWLQFLSIPPALCAVFVGRHESLLTAAWWRAQAELQSANAA